jgi:predicted metal-dependent hydrolase
MAGAPGPAATSARLSSHLPDGVSIQPRRFHFRELDRVPQYWFGGNPILSHTENAFSILIPPGERFFIRSVQRYADRTADPELAQLIRAFARQEALHTRAHDEFNASLARFGVDVEREIAYADRVLAALARWLPAKMQLAVTVFLEHLTATGAHVLFGQPEIARAMHPEMLRFWRWHAAEELEHKAVAFDLYREVGGGYLLRVFSALAAALLLAFPFVRIARRMLRDDPNGVTDGMRRQARELNRRVMGPQLRMIAAYFRPGFHPWQCRDEAHLAGWYASPDTGATPGGG